MSDGDESARYPGFVNKPSMKERININAVHILSAVKW
jgi:hypothetical protein